MGEEMSLKILIGPDMRKVLKDLPESLNKSSWLEKERNARNSFILVIREFYTIYKIINSNSPSSSDKRKLFEKTNNWIKQFLHLSRYFEGFDQKKIYLLTCTFSLTMFQN
jgi:hypothetical protein